MFEHGITSHSAHNKVTSRDDFSRQIIDNTKPRENTKKTHTQLTVMQTRKMYKTHKN